MPMVLVMVLVLAAVIIAPAVLFRFRAAKLLQSMVVQNQAGGLVIQINKQVVLAVHKEWIVVRLLFLVMQKL